MINNSFKMYNNYTSWFEKVYPQLTNYGTWLRGGEINTLPPDEYKLRPFRVLFVRLSTYADVASSFTHLLLYQIATSLPDVFADVAYLPPKNDAEIFKKDNIPWCLGTNTKFGPDKFSLIGFSNSIIQETLNIPKFLKTSRIPLKRNNRLSDEDIPLIILGGNNAIHTTFMWGADSLVDGVFIGTGSKEIKDLLSICAKGKISGKPKLKVLEELEKLGGFYQTGQSKISKKNIPQKSTDIEVLEKGIVTYNQEEIGSGFLQISEGCRGLCSFCAENWTRKPYRELDINLLLEKALSMKALMGLSKIDLFSFNFNMHSKFYSLLWKLLPYFKEISLKSQRVDMLLGNESMIECQKYTGKSIFSVGVEGVSPRIRRYLNKNLDEDALYRGIELIFKIKARELKIFMLSTGIENDDDFIEFEKFINRITQIRKKYHAQTRIIFSITPLVKFPWTPLEFDKAAAPALHNNIISKITHTASIYKYEARQAMDIREYLISQILVRLYDPRITGILLNVLDKTDFTYYSHITGEFFSSFTDAIKKEGLKIETLLDGFSYEESLQKPWAVINWPIKRRFLWDTYQKNIRFNQIGAPLDKIQIERPPYEAEEYKKKIEDIKNNEIAISFYINIRDTSRGLSRKYIATALASALMKGDDNLIPYYRCYKGSYWDKDSKMEIWVTGDDIINLIWHKDALPRLKKKMAQPDFIKVVNTHLERWGALKGFGDTKQLFKLNIHSPFKFDEHSYFDKRGLKYTLRKDGPASYYMNFTQESLRKNIISQCHFSNDNGAFVEIIPQDKFDAEEFTKEAFLSSSKNDWVRIQVIASVI